MVRPEPAKIDCFQSENYLKNNEYRLITVIHYNRFKVYIRQVLTHGEYDKNQWKGD
jgi:mRNA-degrading endonuclease HigB of HigAB toxin-antitoxin module